MKKTSTIGFSLAEIKAFVSDDINCRTQLGLAAVVETIPSLRGGKSCPILGKVAKISLYKGFTFASYAAKIEGSASIKSGMTETERVEYHSEKPRGRHWVDGFFGSISQSDTNPDQYYLSLTGGSEMLIESTYVFDGHIATEEELSLIKEWLKPVYASKKQAEYGITTPNRVKTPAVKLENIRCLSTSHTEAAEVYRQLTATA